MGQATDEQLLAAITKLRAARKTLQEALKAKDTVDREHRAAHAAYDDAAHAAAKARSELDRLMDEDAR